MKEEHRVAHRISKGKRLYLTPQEEEALKADFTANSKFPERQQKTKQTLLRILFEEFRGNVTEMCRFLNKAFPQCKDFNPTIVPRAGTHLFFLRNTPETIQHEKPR
jgi:hypothetical protein